MSRIYDNWERLVDATLKRELLRHIALHCESFSSTASESSGFTFDPFLDDVSGPNPFSFDELRNATGNFQPDSLVGQGRFGNIYKGWISEHSTLPAVKPGSGLAIAVKKLKPGAFLDHEEWMREVNYLGQLHHPNLIKLIGYCSEGDNRLLVYEFMPKGSLEMHLSGRGQNQTVSWDTRVNVAICVARGLCFLHDRELKVHGNVKASSILLDGDFSAKLSGFTSAKFNPLAGPIARGDTVHPRFLTSRLPAPEYLMTDELTAKCDVYSFGVFLLELLCGRPLVDLSRVPGEQNLVEWARPYLRDKRRLFRIMDPKLEDLYPKKGARSLAALALQCLSPHPEPRPCMTEVLSALLSNSSKVLKSKSTESTWKSPECNNPMLDAEARNRLS